MKNRILFLSHGNVDNILSNSGSSRTIYQMLQAFYDVTPVNTSLNGWHKWFNIITSFQPKQERWKSRLDINMWSFRRRSKNVSKTCAHLKKRIQAIFQFGALSELPLMGANIPSFIYTDYTNKLAQREFSDWAPFRSKKEMQDWFDAEQGIYSRSSKVFTFSENTRQSIICEYGQTEDKVVSVGAGVHFGLDKEIFRKDYARQHVLFVGRDFERKGGRVLLQAFQRVRAVCPLATLKVVGPKTPVKGDGVIWVGPVTDRHQLKEIFIDATVFVMPSIGEPFGYTFLEAMYYKTPCIGTNRGAMPEIICNGVTGYIVPADDNVYLAGKIIELLKNPDKCRVFGNQGQQRVLERYTWESVGKAIFSIMDREIRTTQIRTN